MTELRVPQLPPRDTIEHTISITTTATDDDKTTTHRKYSGVK